MGCRTPDFPDLARTESRTPCAIAACTVSMRMLVYFLSFTVTLHPMMERGAQIFRKSDNLRVLFHSTFLMRPINCTVSRGFSAEWNAGFRKGTFADLNYPYLYPGRQTGFFL